jgi:hypothetical protein
MKFDSLCDLLNEAVYGEPSILYTKPKDLNQEYIIAAALEDLDTEDIFLGDHHQGALENAQKHNPQKYDKDCWYDYFQLGFYTSKDRFVSRTEAYKIAQQNKQLHKADKYKELDSYYIKESFISELANIYDDLNTSQMEIWQNRMFKASLYWALAGEYGDRKNKNVYNQNTDLLFKEVAKYRPFAIQALKDLHELEYKQSQIKKFYGDKGNILNELNNTLSKIAKWLQIYLNVVLFSRACGDGLTWDDKIDGHNINKSLDLNLVMQNLAKNKEPYKNYVTPIFLELYKAKTLPELLIAISKAKNAEHDGGLIMSEWGTGLFYGNEEAFKEIGNLNYRQLDRELQQELNPI